MLIIHNISNAFPIAKITLKRQSQCYFPDREKPRS